MDSLRNGVFMPQLHIDLSDYNIPEFESLIDDLLARDALTQVFLNRNLTKREEQILVNKNIAAYYHDNVNDQQQISDFAHRFNFSLSRKFNYAVNAIRHNVQLHGLEIADFYTGRAQQEIYRLQSSHFVMLYEAIKANKIDAVKHIIAFGVDPGLPILGRLPLELACEVGAEVICRYLLYSCRIDPNASNPEGINALKQACVNKRINIIKLILESEKFKVCEFLDRADPSYSENFDICKIIIDTDDPSLLDEYLQQKFSRNVGFNQLQALYDYTSSFGGMKILRYIESLITKQNTINQDLMRNIRNGNLVALRESLLASSAINLLIAGKYPMQLACELGHLDVVQILFEFKDINVIWFDYKHVNVLNYNKNLDLIRIAIKHDNHLLLNVLLERLEGKNESLFSGEQRIEKIYAKAIDKNCINILNYLSQLENKKNAIIDELFASALVDDYQTILRTLETGVNINIKVRGTAILHVICEHGNAKSLQVILNNPKHNLDVNVTDCKGRYPLTIACKNGDLKIIQLLLSSRMIRFYAFSEAGQNHYDENLDPIRIAIKSDNCELLEWLLKSTWRRDELIRICSTTIANLYEYAIKVQATDVILQLEHYLNLIRNHRDIFDQSLDANLHATVENQQSISKVESTFIISIKRLCAYFDIQVVPAVSGEYKTLKTTRNLGAVFADLPRMIGNAHDVVYKIYEYGPKQKSEDFSLISDEQYQCYALDLYEQFNNGLRGPFELNGWHTSWCEDDSEKITLGCGISVKDVWCLAILAAQDKYGLDGKYFTDQEIDDREQLLVRALVDSNRAYNCNNDELHDYGGTSRKSCTHGIAIRALLCLSHLHKKIVIESNPIEWAADVAKQTLLDFYQAYPHNAYISDCIRSRAFELKEDQKTALIAFYNDAKLIVKQQLISQIGLVKSGGYLLRHDLSKILDSLEYIQLPDLNVSETQVTAAIFAASDFTVVPGEQIISENGLHLEQCKLPFTADSMYTAILISAYNNGLANLDISTTHHLRLIISHILHACFFATENVDGLMRAHFAHKQQHASAEVFGRILRHKFDNLYPGTSSEQKMQLFESIQHSAGGDNVCLMLISAIYGCRVRLFDLHGGFVVDILSSDLFIPLEHTGVCLNLALKVNYDGHKRLTSYMVCNALVKANSWGLMQQYISILNIKSCADELIYNKQQYRNLEVMVGCGVEGFDQVLIGGNASNLFEAILAGARNVNAQQAFIIEDVCCLKQQVVDEIALLLESERVNQHEGQINVSIVEALTHYNIKYNTSFSLPEEYLAAISHDNFYAGMFEIAIAARILQVNIHVHAVEYDQPLQVNIPQSVATVHLFKQDESYNLLVAPNSWNRLHVKPEEVIHKRSRRSRLRL